MLENIFKGIFDTGLTEVISVSNFLICVGSALIVGLIIAALYAFKTRCTKSFAATLALLPAVVCVVIMMVNGNVGAGLICGMGYIAYAVLFSVVLSVVSLIYSCFDFGIGKKTALYKTLHITIPEDLDYTGVFEDLLNEYASKWELVQVKTTNMGSLFRLTYNLTLRTGAKEKELIDKLRCRNGNLEITVSKQETNVYEL